MSEPTRIHQFDRPQFYPLLVYVEFGPARWDYFPVIGWCACGSAYIAHYKTSICITQSSATEQIVDLPDNVERFCANRNFQQNDFERAAARAIEKLTAPRWVPPAPPL